MTFQHQTLTPGRVSPMMRPVVATAAAGRGNPSYSGVNTPIYGVFLCPSFWQALGFAVSVMAGCSGQAKAWPVPESGISTPLHPVARTVESIGDGLSLFIQDKSL